ncbi:MAG: sulfurtransferase [Firmicutes bacterium]|nr:sulfurtransferase [Bacillota bacterium]
MHKLQTILSVSIIILLSILMSACGQASNNSSPVPSYNVSIDQALTDWQNKSVVILDVRTPGEYADGHIPNTMLIPLDQLPERLNEVPKEKKVYVICRSGNRSAQAVNLLRSKGFTNVYNVTGGMMQWKGPVEK